jgi:hypothetical protein
LHSTVYNSTGVDCVQCGETDGQNESGEAVFKSHSE